VEQIDPSLSIRSVTLAVSDLERSAAFYEQVLGLPLLARDEEQALLGSDAAYPALRLSRLADARPAPPHSTGLFHVAWLHPTRAGLAETIRRVLAAGRGFDGASDHGVSEALYISDPDGLGIELYVDRPREQWEPGSTGRGVHMVTLPLDVEDLLAQSESAPGPEIEPGTVIGHVHLKVADVEAASAFYEQRLGFEEQARIPSASFVSAGGYHHHIGLNSWQSRGAEAAGEDSPRLRQIDFALADAQALEALERRAGDAVEAAAREDAIVSLRDPDAQRLSFHLR
jgi:catechol 2,3-dioxygenase